MPTILLCFHSHYQYRELLFHNFRLRIGVVYGCPISIQLRTIGFIVQFSHLETSMAQIRLSLQRSFVNKNLDWVILSPDD